MTQRKYKKQFIEKLIRTTGSYIHVKEIMEIMEEYGTDICIEPIDYHDYGGSYPALRIYEHREETDEEFAKRVYDTEKQYKLQEESERLQYEQLKKKFENE